MAFDETVDDFLHPGLFEIDRQLVSLYGRDGAIPELDVEHPFSE